eukprot:3516299-Rhodomonas_salina.2
MLLRGLYDARDDDLILMSDVDEIPSATESEKTSGWSSVALVSASTQKRQLQPSRGRVSARSTWRENTRPRGRRSDRMSKTVRVTGRVAYVIVDR